MMSVLKPEKFQEGKGRRKLDFYFDLSPKPASSEEIRYISEEVEKYAQRNMMFTGEYRCVIKDGRVAVPWRVCASEDPLCWMILDHGEGQEIRQKIILMPESHRGEDGEIAVSAEGICQFDEQDLWMVPDGVLTHLNSLDCVFLGAGNHGELLSCDAYERIRLADHELVDMIENPGGLRNG